MNTLTVVYKPWYAKKWRFISIQSLWPTITLHPNYQLYNIVKSIPSKQANKKSLQEKEA